MDYMSAGTLSYCLAQSARFGDGVEPGNKSKKTSYLKLGAVNKVVEILSTDSSAIALVQSAAAVGRYGCVLSVVAI